MIDNIVTEDIKKLVNELQADFLKGNNILVSGGAGFLGSFICDVLVEVGAIVTCLDNFSTGLTENIDHLENRVNFKLVKGDVSSFDSEEKFDFILHFASRASPEDYQLHPIDTLLTNSLGSSRLLELARKQDSNILFASTSEIYGCSKVIPTPETCPAPLLLYE